jgi:hypothetical protein
MPIPEVIHFIWISLGEKMTELQRICIGSAVLNTKCKIVLHTDDASVVLPGVETRLREFPTSINGKPFNKNDSVGFKSHLFSRVSHLKDVVRLQILFEEGGIYSDLDMLWLRHPWRWLDCGKGVVMGYQTKVYKTLCNAVIFATPAHPLIKMYLDWTISIYPPKKYWIPANPYKIWVGHNTDALYEEKYHFFQKSFNTNKAMTFEDFDRSTAIHLNMTAGNEPYGELFDSLKQRCKAFIDSPI